MSVHTRNASQTTIGQPQGIAPTVDVFRFFALLKMTQCTLHYVYSSFPSWRSGMVQTVNSVREPYSFGSRTELTVQKNGIRQQGRMHSSINKNAILVVNLNRRLTTVSSVPSVSKTKTLCIRVSTFQINCPLLAFCKMYIRPFESSVFP